MKRSRRQEKIPKGIEKQIIPLRKALMWIFLSVAAISGTGYAGFLYYRNLRDRQRQDSSFNIVAVAQTTADSRRLSTSCLAELLDLSIDHPKNFFCFNVKEAEEKLKRVPVIKQAHVKKIPPGIVHVDYVLRRPIALLGDFTNTALDAEGVSFPVKPFFTPKKLPEIYLGQFENEGHDSESKGSHWGETLSGRRIELALSIVDLLNKNYTHPLVSISCVDVSKAFASSCGERQIVVVLEELIEVLTEKQGIRNQLRVLRLGTDNYEEQLKNYLVLQKHLWTETSIEDKKVARSTVIDLRLSDLAFIEE